MVLWKGKWAILAAAVLAVLLGGIYAYRLAAPMYRTHAVVMFDPQEQTVVDLGSIIPALSREETVVTTQVELLRSRRLMEKLVLQLNLISDPEFNPYLGKPKGFSPKKMVKEQLQRYGYIRTEVKAPPSLQTTMDATVNAVLSQFSITNLPSSLIFSVSVETEYPRKSSAIANTLAKLYIDDQLTAKQEATEQATEWLTHRVADLKSEYQTAEQAAQALRSAIDPDARAALIDIERELSALEIRLASTELAPQAQTLLKRNQNALQTRLAKTSAELINLQQFEQEAEASRLIYEYFLGRLKETSVQQGIQRPDARIISRAIVPLHPAAPKKLLILAISGIIGAAIGAAIVMIRDR